MSKRKSGGWGDSAREIITGTVVTLIGGVLLALLLGQFPPGPRTEPTLTPPPATTPAPGPTATDVPGATATDAPGETATPADFPTVTPSRTPAPDSTDTPIPPTPLPDPALYDGFDRGIFDGSYDAALWSAEGAGVGRTLIYQQGGVLNLANPEPGSGDIRLVLDDWDAGGGPLAYFEADVRLSGEDSGVDGGAGLYVQYSAIPQRWTALMLVNAAQGAAVVPLLNGEADIDMMAPPDVRREAWITLRIQYDEARKTFFYFADGTLIASHEVRGGAPTLRPALRFAPGPDAPALVQVDDVRISR